ncbi:MAG: hypothetical protein WCF85_17500, partial [Rhodospirillaceae bacterium]
DIYPLWPRVMTSCDWYDMTLRIDDRALDEDLDALRHADTGPMGAALVTRTMPQAGGRPDIGPVTAWAARFIISQDLRAERVMLAVADAAGSIPWHFRDEATGAPVRIDHHPRLWIDERGPIHGPDALGTPYIAIDRETGWSPDTAHTPTLSYVPYLFTGSRYRLDELEAAVAWRLASLNPGYREGVPNDQVRATAWGLRDLGDAAFIVPDADPLKAYFTTRLQHQLEVLVESYVTRRGMAAAGEVEGWIRGDYGTPGVTAPWQQDFLVITLATLQRRGVITAAPLLAWMNNFITGRFLAGDRGFDPRRGATYNLKVFNSLTGAPYATWAKVFAESFDGSPLSDQIDGDPRLATGYAAVARAALAGLICANGSPRAVEAYRYLTERMGEAGDRYRRDPTWAIRPASAPLEFFNARASGVRGVPVE